MTILIDNRSGTPIYDQIFTQIKNQIVMPSIRSLAKDLRISVITTKRAYDELESAGFIYTLPGKGSFVSQRNTQLVREENLKEIEEHLLKIRQLAAQCGLSRRDIIEMFNILEDET